MKKIVFCILILLSCLAASLFAQEGNTDENAIREIIEQFTPMWTTQNGVAIFRKLTSDTYYMYFSTNSILRKEDFTRLLVNMLQDNPPVKHTHTIKKIVISDALAFEYGIVELMRKNGQTTKSEALNVFFREESGWKLIMSLPVAEIRKVITD